MRWLTVAAACALAPANARGEPEVESGAVLQAAAGAGPIALLDGGEVLARAMSQRLSVRAGWAHGRWTLVGVLAQQSIGHDLPPIEGEEAIDRSLSWSSVDLGLEGQLRGGRWRIGAGGGLAWFGTASRRGKTARGIGLGYHAAFRLIGWRLIGTEQGLDLAVEGATDVYRDGLVVGHSLSLGWEMR